MIKATRDKVLAAAVALSVPLLVTLEGYPGGVYVDVAGILTDCYGNTHNVTRGHTRTQAECEAMLGTEVGRIGRMLLQDVPGHNVYTLASGISFVYNVGDGAYRGSTYRKRLKAGKYEEACYQMHRWKYITQRGKKVESKGLVNRRNEEVALCLKGT